MVLLLLLGLVVALSTDSAYFMGSQLTHFGMDQLPVQFPWVSEPSSEKRFGLIWKAP